MLNVTLGDEWWRGDRASLVTVAVPMGRASTFSRGIGRVNCIFFFCAVTSSQTVMISSGGWIHIKWRHLASPSQMKSIRSRFSMEPIHFSILLTFTQPPIDREIDLDQSTFVTRTVKVTLAIQHAEQMPTTCINRERERESDNGYSDIGMYQLLALKTNDTCTAAFSRHWLLPETKDMLPL